MADAHAVTAVTHAKLKRERDSLAGAYDVDAALVVRVP